MSQKREIPKGWFVFEAGQFPTNLLWFVNLVNKDDLNSKKLPRQIKVEKKESYESALNDAISLIK